MEFMYTVTKNNQLIAGFTKYIDACIYKEFLMKTNRMAGYKDKFKIVGIHSK